MVNGNVYLILLLQSKISNIFDNFNISVHAVSELVFHFTLFFFLLAIGETLLFIVLVNSYN